MNSLIFGRRRQGKSTLSLALAVARKDTIVVFDPNLQFKLPYARVVNTPETLESGLDASFDAPLTVLVWRPDPGDVEASFAEMAEVLHQFEDYALVIDEASELQRAQGMSPALAMLLRQHPDSVDIFQSTHRVVDVHPLSRSLATDWFFFQSTSAKDLDLIVQATEVPELAVEIPKLDRWQVIHYWLGQGGTRHWEKWTDSKGWFVAMADEPINPPSEGATGGDPNEPVAAPVNPAKPPASEDSELVRQLKKVNARLKRLERQNEQLGAPAPVTEAPSPAPSAPTSKPEPVVITRRCTTVERFVRRRRA